MVAVEYRPIDAPPVGKPGAQEPPPGPMGPHEPLPRPFHAAGTEYAVVVVTGAIRRHQAQTTVLRMYTLYQEAKLVTARWAAARLAAELAGDFDQADYLLGYEMPAWEAEMAVQWDWQCASRAALETAV